MHFQIMAFAVLLFFYGAYFIKMLSQRRKGIITDQIGKGKHGIEKIIEISMKIITVIIPIGQIISIVLKASFFPHYVRYIGFALALIGTCVFILSILQMADSWRAGVSKNEKTALVTTGVYAFSRNPAFLGFDLVYIGILLMFFNPILWILSFLGAFIFHLQIVNVEEEFLLSSFGQEYLNYKKAVNRYIGRRSKK